MTTFPKPGKVESIIIRPERRKDCKYAESVEVNIEEGIVGDHYKGLNKKRQVTLIQKEHLIAVGSILGQEPLDPLKTRRNLVVSGINLLALKGRKFQIGTVILETTGPCEPCSRMETYFGKGAYNALRGHGGITARVLQPGTITTGDEVNFLE